MDRLHETDVWQSVERGIAGRKGINKSAAARGSA
jgi:hypothetical protein